MNSPSAAPPAAQNSRCRFCSAPLQSVVADLGMSPLANEYVLPDRAGEAETFYPLRAFVCDRCMLVQLEEFASPDEIFSEYLYFSSYSSSWLHHARRFVEEIVPRLSLDRSSRVVEVASNDGYLLQYLVERGIPVLGIEPGANVAAEAIQRGVPTLVEFFGRSLAERLRDRWSADLLIANNVVPHVPDLNDFIAGCKLLLAPAGTLTIEFGHLLNLIDQNQFDTIYHEHFSYLSLHTACRVLEHHGLNVFDVEELPTHGGSLRLYARHADDERPVSSRVRELRDLERAAGLEDLDRYGAFADGVERAKREILGFLIEQADSGRSVVGYGAPAKATTLFNYCGIGPDLLAYTVDVSPHKQGHLVPGARIPIHAPAMLSETQPDIVLILPWNLREEIAEQHAYVRQWNGRFAITQPTMTLLD